MKLRNKKTGEIADQVWWDNEVDELCINGNKMYFYNSLAELNEEWEDVSEEPKGNWTIDPVNEDCIDDGRYTTPDELERYRELGLAFETKEEAEKAVEKLKAWKRLKDKGFRFTGYSHYDWNGNENPAIAFEYSDFDEMFYDKQVATDIDLLFGGEE